MKVLKFWIALNFDGYGGHSLWVWAPPEWDEMSQKQQEKFEDDQIQSYLNQEVEYGMTVYNSLAEARKNNNGSTRFMSSFSAEEVEDWYGALDQNS